MDNALIIERIRAITSPEEMARVASLIRAEPGPMATEVQTVLLEKLVETTALSKTAREGVISVLKVHGVEYPLTDWLTPKNYATKFGVKSVETILNWMSRGVIPEDHIKEIPELGLRLVKAVEYSPRPYNERVGPPTRVKDAS